MRISHSIRVVSTRAVWTALIACLIAITASTAASDPPQAKSTGGNDTTLFTPPLSTDKHGSPLLIYAICSVLNASNAPVFAQSVKLLEVDIYDGDGTVFTNSPPSNGCVNPVPFPEKGPLAQGEVCRHQISIDGGIAGGRSNPSRSIYCKVTYAGKNKDVLRVSLTYDYFIEGHADPLHGPAVEAH